MAATETAARELPAVSDTSQATPDRKHFTSKHKLLNAGSLRHPDFNVAFRLVAHQPLTVQCAYVLVDYTMYHKLPHNSITVVPR